MKHPVLLGTVATCFCVAMTGPLFAADPPPTAAAVVKPAENCLGGVRALSAQMQKDGYWLGGSDYGFGYPMGGYGYGDNYPMGSPPGAAIAYQNARPGYEVRNLITAANILAENGKQQACEDVLAATRTLYEHYSAELHNRGVSAAGAPGWQRQQIAAALPVTDKTALRSGELIDTAVRSAQDVGLGSVHDLVMSPTTGKLAYLIIERGGIFGIDAKFVPVPWNDFRVTQAANLVVLDTDKATMDGAPQVTDAAFTAAGQFAEHSAQVDSYWKAHLPANNTN